MSYIAAIGSVGVIEFDLIVLKGTILGYFFLIPLPQMIILDEPSNDLDVSIAVEERVC